MLSSVVVTDNLLRYFKDVCKAFTVRYQQLGGKVLTQESFTQGDKTINNVVTRVNKLQPGQYDVRVLPTPKTLADFFGGSGGGADSKLPFAPKITIVQCSACETAAALSPYRAWSRGETCMVIPCARGSVGG